MSDTIAVEDYNFMFLEKDGVSLYVIMANQYESSDINVADGQVVGVILDYNSESIPASIAGDIALGSTYDDVISAFGTPDFETEEDGDAYLSYESADTDDIFSSLEIWLEDGVVNEIDLLHW